MGTLQGVLEGFTAARDARMERDFRESGARRQAEGELYKYLLNSRDPKIQSLALTGLFDSAQPTKRKGGLAGFMGEVQSSPIYPQILAAMNEQVPDDGPGGGGMPGPPATPGSAAMPSGSPVTGAHVGQVPAPTQPTQMPQPGPPAPPDFSQGGAAGIEQQENPTEAGGPPGGPPGLPPGLLQASTRAGQLTTSRFKRRGTGVPTAEEIAEAHEAAVMRGKIREGQAGITAAGGDQEAVLRATSGMLGAPLPPDRFTKGELVQLQDGTVIPTTRDSNGHLLDARTMTPLPPGATAYTTAKRELATTIPDSPAIRAQYGIGANEPNPTGYWRIQTYSDGTVDAQPTTYAPPPDFGGTATLYDAGSPTGASVNRLGRNGGVNKIGAAAPPQSSTGMLTETATKAQAVVAAVKDRVANRSQLDKALGTADLDRLTQEEARKLGLAFPTYAAAQAASKQRTARANPGGGSATVSAPGEGAIDPQRLLDRMNANRQAAQGGQAPQAPPAQPPPPPHPPLPSLPAPARAAGPGTRR